MFLGRTASEQGGHLGLMALTTGGQIEAITWNTSQGFATALSAFVAQNYAARQVARVLKAYHTDLVDDFYLRHLLYLHFLYAMVMKYFLSLYLRKQLTKPAVYFYALTDTPKYL